MRTNAIVLALGLAATVRAADPAVNPVTISPVTASRGGDIRVTVPNAPPVNKAAITLISRSGAVPAFDAASVKDGTVEFAVPANLPLGSYAVTVALGSARFTAGEWLKVTPAPQWQVRLTKIEPATTYDTETVWEYDTTRPSAEGKPLNVAEVVLRGDDAILRNGVPEVVAVSGRREPVIASGCSKMPPPGTREAPVPNAVYGEMADGGIRLCRVPLPANGRLEVMIGNTPFTAEPGRTETVWVPDYGPRQIRTARLKLVGSGYLQDRPEDNEILANGVHLHVAWDTCSQLPGPGTKDHPIENQVHGRVLSADEIELCRVPVPAGGDILFTVRQGDLLSEPRAFKVFRYSRVLVAVASAIAAGALGLVVLILMGFLKKHHLAKNVPDRLRMLFLDPETNTYSLSKLQFYLWTGAALFGYSYLVISKMLVQREGWPDIPGTLPGIVAIGAGTAIGSQVVTSVRGPKGSGAEAPNFSDFVTSGGVAAADRIQMLVWTLFGVGAFCLAVVQQTPGDIKELSPVPEGMLYLMGLSSIGYLGGKLARKPGPIINEISITPSESDADVAGAAAAPAAALPSFAQPVAQAQAVAEGLPSVPSASARKAVDALTGALAAARNAKTAADVAALISGLPEFRALAESAAAAAAQEYSQTGAPPEAAAAAEIAQRAAAAVQDLGAGVTQAVAAATPPRATGPAGFTRAIELRGRNLSAEGLVEIDGGELPFRMLMKHDGKKLPQIVLREEDNPSMARVLRLCIDPAELEAPDLERYRRWFGKNSVRPLILTITNPDGQKADISFTIPPGAAQSAAKAGEEPRAAAPGAPAVPASPAAAAAAATRS